MSGNTDQVREWAREQGMNIAANGRMPAKIRAAYDAAHTANGVSPDPGMEDPEAFLADEGQAEEPREFTPDPEPKRPKASAIPPPPAKSRKVADGVRKDIRAKTALLLTFPATFWAGRDPLCGSAALECLDPVATALADIFCDSPDVVAFFTSAGGSYIKWLNLAVACQPLAETFVRHHVTHTIGQSSGVDGAAARFEPQDLSAYHAPAF